MWSQPIAASLAAGKDAYPAGFGGSVVGQSTIAGQKMLEGKGYLCWPYMHIAASEYACFMRYKGISGLL